MANGRPRWTFGPAPSGRRPPETGGQLILLQRVITKVSEYESSKLTNSFKSASSSNIKMLYYAWIVFYESNTALIHGSCIEIHHMDDNLQLTEMDSQTIFGGSLVLNDTLNLSLIFEIKSINCRTYTMFSLALNIKQFILGYITTFQLSFIHPTCSHD